MNDKSDTMIGLLFLLIPLGAIILALIDFELVEIYIPVVVCICVVGVVIGAFESRNLKCTCTYEHRVSMDDERIPDPNCPLSWH